jgi:hypothetical protein
VVWQQGKRCLKEDGIDMPPELYTWVSPIAWSFVNALKELPPFNGLVENMVCKKGNISDLQYSGFQDFQDFFEIF